MRSEHDKIERESVITLSTRPGHRELTVATERNARSSPLIARVFPMMVSFTLDDVA
jgi:hypothetical protein